MTKLIKKWIEGGLICLLFVPILTGCEEVGHSPANDSKNTLLNYAVIYRFDRQNDVYFQLAQQIESYIISEERILEETKFTAFCSGINCFIRDEMISNLYEEPFENDERLIKTTKKLMGFTAGSEMERIQLAEFSEEELGQIKDLFYELADCCNREEKNSFAYCISMGEFKDDVYEEAIEQTETLLSEIEKIIENRN